MQGGLGVGHLGHGRGVAQAGDELGVATREPHGVGGAEGSCGFEGQVGVCLEGRRQLAADAGGRDRRRVGLVAGAGGTEGQGLILEAGRCRGRPGLLGFAEQLELTGGALRIHRVDAAREEAGGGVEVPEVGGLLGKEEARCGSDERSSWWLNPCTCTPAYRPGCTDRTDRTERTR